MERVGATCGLGRRDTRREELEGEEASEWRNQSFQLDAEAFVAVDRHGGEKGGLRMLKKRGKERWSD